MRKIKGEKAWFRQEIKDVPLGTCPLCGGRGRYKETFRHKNPIIHSCLKCSGTGKVDIKVKYKGSMEFYNGFKTDSLYTVMKENDNHYILTDDRGIISMMAVEDFELVK